MNNSYVLLRNNVESTSLNLDELKQIGLVETDLVWVECQSVCWQNPKEIPELRNLLQSASQQQKITSEKNVVQQNSVSATALQVSNGEKHVHVVLPGDNAKDTPVKKPAADAVLIDMKKYGDPGKKYNPLKDQDQSDATLSNDKPVNDIPDYFNKKQTVKANQSRPGFAVPGKIKKIVAYTGLVGLGALLMFFVMKNDRNKSIVQTTAQQPEKNLSVNTVPAETLNEINTSLENSSPDPDVSLLDEPGNRKTQKNTSQNRSNTSITATSNEAEVPEEDLEKKEPVTPAEPKPKPVKKITPEIIRSKLAVTANEYTVGSFGGIKDLEVTLQNSSEYILDYILVEINYLNPEGKTVKSDKINFQSVAPGGVVTLPVKKSRRGVKVDLAVTKIESKEITAINANNNDSLNYSKN